MRLFQGWRLSAITPAALMAAGCASTSQLHPLGHTYVDQPDQARIEVRYRNPTAQGVCVLPEHWPNQGGKMDTDGSTVFLSVDGRRFPLKAFNTGYCWGDCSTYVAPGEEIVGHLSYQDFGLPEALENIPKRLELEALGYACRPPGPRSP